MLSKRADRQCFGAYRNFSPRCNENPDWLSKGYLDLKRDNPKAGQKYFPQYVGLR